MSKDTASTVSRCPTVLIPDRIATEDAFRHGEVSHAIAAMIDGNEGGCAIALTGSWGSGKSTVVNLLADKLKKVENPVPTFIFDAWAHQGDPLRRTFLEKLIDWCDNELKWTKGSTDWSGIVEELARRKEVVRTESSPRLGRWGIAGALSLLIAPVALQIYQKVHHEWHPIWEAIALLLSALPLIVASALWASWSFKGRGKGERDREPLPNLIFTTTENTTISKTNKTPDPTSVEFEKIYQELLGEVLRDEKRRILLVIDNLDRVRHEDALSIWATLRIFFDPSTKGRSDWRSRVWVLVPFDPEAISDLWDTGDATAAKGHTAASRHFLEKTFQATFHVPPVILTNWEKYLIAQLRRAFPDSRHTAEEFHTIFRLYDHLVVSGRLSPTPRNLKIFVNGLGALHAQWQERIPLSHQAAFVLLTENETNGAFRTLLSAEPASFPSHPQTLNVLLGEGWQKNLAALHFNVEPEDAYQALLRQPITNALRDGNGDELAVLAKYPGFYDVLETIIEQPGLSVQIDPEKIANSAKAFASLTDDWESKGRCQGHLLRASSLVKDWSPFNASIASGIKVLIQIASNDSTVSPLIRSVCDSLKLNTSGNSEGNSSDWCAGIAILLPTLAQRKNTALLREFKVKCDPSTYFTILSKMRDLTLPEDLWRYLQPAATEKDLIDSLAQAARSGNWTEMERFAARKLQVILQNVDVAPLIAALQSRITDHPQPLPNDVPEVLKTLIEFASRTSLARNALENTAQGEALIQLTSLLHQAGNLEAVALCMLPLLSSSIQIQSPTQNQGWQQNTPQWRSWNGRQLLTGWFQNPATFPSLDAAMTHCLAWRSFAEWRETSTQKPDRAQLIRRMLAARFKQAHPYEVDTDEFVANNDFWRGEVDESDLERVFQEKAATGEMATCLSNLPFNLKLIHLYVLAMGEGGTEAYRKFLISALSGVTKEQWLAGLNGETEILELALSLKTVGLTLGLTFQDALFAHVESKLNQSARTELSRNWSDVINLLAESDLSAFRQRLLDVFKSVKGRIGGVLPYYGPIVTQLVLEDGPEKSYERVKQIIENHDRPEVEWLTALAQEWTPQSRSTKDTCKTLSMRVEEVLQKDLSEDLRGSLQNLLDALNGKRGN